MKKYSFLIVLMLVAMLGLIGFQWYWIQNAFAVKRDQFDRKVKESLNETVRKIEKQEVLFWTKQKLKAEEKQRNDSLLQQKSIKKYNKERIHIAKKKETPEEIVKNSTQVPKSFEIYNGFPTDVVLDKRFQFPQNKIAFLREMLAQENLIWEELNMDMQEMILQQQSIDDIFEVLNEQSFVIKHEKSLENLPKPESDVIPKEKVPKNNRNLKDEYNKTKNKVDLVKDVLRDIVRGDRKIYQRLNQEMIDTLLTREFKIRGIDLPFEYGIKNQDKMIFTSFGLNKNPELISKTYQVALFPNDEVSQNQILHVYFPQKQNYLLENLWSVFGSSFFLIIMIGGLFYSSIQTIINQKKLSDIKNDFINNMTHELKTPIATISLAVEVMSDKTIQKNEEKSSRYLNMIRDENKRLANHVERVLQMALLDKGDIKFNFTEVDAHEIIEQVCQNLSLQVEQLHGNISIDLEADHFILKADEVHLLNVFYNLLDNAIKYSKESPIIEIKTYNTDNEFVMSVKDQGIGMSKDQITKVFDKFYRIPTGNLHDVKGFGLGLSYVKKIMEIHKGNISVQSKIGEGSEFELRFPIHQS